MIYGRRLKEIVEKWCPVFDLAIVVRKPLGRKMFQFGGEIEVRFI